MCAVCLGPGYYGYLVGAYYGRGPSPLVDYVAAMNAEALSIAEGERAWPVYRRAFALIGADRPRTLGEAPAVGDVVPPGEEAFEWGTLIAYLDSSREGMGLLREAAGMERMGLPLGRAWVDEQAWGFGPERSEWDGYGSWTAPAVWEDSLIEVLLPHLLLMRQSALMLADDMRVAQREGDGARMAANFEAILGIGRHAGTPSLLINGLVEVSISVSALTRLRSALHESPEVFSDADLARVAGALAGLDDARLRLRYDGEVMMLRDCVQRVFTDDGRGNGYLTREMTTLLGYGSPPTMFGRDGTAAVRAMEALWMPVYARWFHADRRETERSIEELFALLEADIATPVWERGEFRFAVRVREMTESPAMVNPHGFIVYLLPRLSSGVERMELIRRERDVLRMAVALERYRRARGGLPREAGELTPAFLDVIPRDWFDGAGLRFVTRGGEGVVYSVGIDGEDDGGDAVEDVILWPPDWGVVEIEGEEEGDGG